MVHHPRAFVPGLTYLEQMFGDVYRVPVHVAETALVWSWMAGGRRKGVSYPAVMTRWT